jgi:hypothetical protein
MVLSLRRFKLVILVTYMDRRSQCKDEEFGSDRLSLYMAHLVSGKSI